MEFLTERHLTNLINAEMLSNLLLFSSHAVLQMVIERTMKDDTELDKKENETSGNKTKSAQRETFSYFNK